MDDGNIRNDSISVTTTSIQLSPRRNTFQDMRQEILIRNNSTNVADIITLSLGNTQAIDGAGIVLEKGQAWGGSNDLGILWKGAIQCVCKTANGVLSVMER